MGSISSSKTSFIWLVAASVISFCGLALGAGVALRFGWMLVVAANNTEPVLHDRSNFDLTWSMKLPMFA